MDDELQPRVPSAESLTEYAFKNATEYSLEVEKFKVPN